MAEAINASAVNVQFMDGESLTLPVTNGACVKDLMVSVNAAKPPPKPHARLKFALEDGRTLAALESTSCLIGATVSAIYSSSECAYLVRASDGSLELVDEGDEAWSEALGSRSSVPEDKWVPAPTVEEFLIENLAKESDGATVTASSNIFGDAEKLNNVIRLGSRFGNPRYMPEGDNSFIFKGDDKDPTLSLDLGRIAVLTRVGSMCYSDRWLNFFQVESSEGGDSWVPWGEDRKHRRKGGVVFFDRPPTTARFIRFRATSGHVDGARIGPLFAFGCVGPVPVTSAESAISSSAVKSETDA